MTPTPPEGFAAFDFQAGRHGGNGVWYGCYSYNVSNYSVIHGTYELRMFTRDEGTLSPLPNRENQGFNVGDVNLRKGVLELGGTEYRRVR